MAELGHDMDVNDVDVRPVVPSYKSKLRGTFTTSLTELLDPIRQVVREEVKSALHYEQRMVSESVFGRSSMSPSLSIIIS